VVAGCVVEVSAYVDDVSVVNGSVDGGSVVAATEDVVIAVSATEAYTNMPTHKRFCIHSNICRMTGKQINCLKWNTKIEISNHLQHRLFCIQMSNLNSGILTRIISTHSV